MPELAHEPSSAADRTRASIAQLKTLGWTPPLVLPVVPPKYVRKGGQLDADRDDPVLQTVKRIRQAAGATGRR